MSASRAPTWHTVVDEPRGGPAYRVGERDGLVVAEWGGAVTLEVTRSGERVRLIVADGVDPFLLRKLESGPIVALERRLRGELTFHGGAVARGGRGLLLLGPSGAGKSTTVGALVARGCALVSDDMAWLDMLDGPPRLVPSESHLYLQEGPTRALGLEKEVDHVYWDETTKCGVPVPHADTTVPLAAVVRLEWGPEIELARHAGVGALDVLLPHVVRSGLPYRELWVTELDRLGRLTERVPVYSLTRPRAFERLGECSTVLMHLLEPEP